MVIKKSVDALAVEYFAGYLSFNEWSMRTEERLSLSVSDETGWLSVHSKERVMFVSNHPKTDESLWLRASEIAKGLGGNTYGFTWFHCPIVRQILLRKALVRPFCTMAINVGWKDAMNEMSCVTIPKEGAGRIYKFVKEIPEMNSAVVFPEGRVTNLREFHSGFYHIARILGIKNVVVGIFSPVLTLGGLNVLKIVRVVELPTGFSQEEQRVFVENIRVFIAKEVMDHF